MFDQYGRPIVETYDRDGNLIIGGKSTPVKAISFQEKKYITAMAEAAQEYLTSIVVIANQLQDGFDDYPNEVTRSYQEVIERNLDVAKTLRLWAINNSEMNRFPANYDELTDAIKLTTSGKQKFLKLRSEYVKTVQQYPYFYGCPDQKPNIAQVGLKIERLHVMILNAQGSVAEDKYTVNPKLLSELPPAH